MVPLPLSALRARKVVVRTQRVNLGTSRRAPLRRHTYRPPRLLWHMAQAAQVEGRHLQIQGTQHTVCQLVVTIEPAPQPIASYG